MKHNLMKTVVYIVAGVLTVYLFSGGGKSFEGFPWEVYAGVGMISWVGQQVLKFIRDVNKVLDEK